jgi:selenocysteine lyase/cysteine desulfurase
VEYVDLLAADAHKWLLGPCAAGMLYVRQEVQSFINPPVYGWHNVRCPDFVAQEQLNWRNGAKKFEVGTQNLLGLVGLMAALDLIAEVGVENVAAELLRKRARLVPQLRTKGYTVLNGDAAAENASGIVSFHKPDTDLPKLHQQLTEHGIITSLRADRKGQKYIRLSPHFYNSEEELDRTLAVL